jgi:NTP pyrophosphatase (non-canonical NTP hydrolase)
MKMMRLETIGEIDKRIAAADARYGPFASTHEALGVCLEEWEELREAVQSNALDAVRHEALDLAAACLRLAETVGSAAFDNRSGK